MSPIGAAHERAMDDSVVTSVNAMSPCLHVSEVEMHHAGTREGHPEDHRNHKHFFLYFFSTSKKKMPPADYNSQRSGP